MSEEQVRRRALISHAADELRLFGEPVDSVTLAFELERSGELNAVGGRMGLAAELAEGIDQREPWRP